MKYLGSMIHRMMIVWGCVWWIVVVFAVSAVCECPRDFRRHVRICMEPLEGYAVDKTDLLNVVSTIEKTSQLCLDGKIQDAFSCLNQLYNRCAATLNRGSHASLLVEVDNWKMAMNNICGNMQYLQDNAECEKNVSAEYDPCARAELAWFIEKFSERRETAHVSRTGREKMNLGCELTGKILNCLRTPFEKYCPPEMNSLLVSVVHNFIPPACAKTALSKNSMKPPVYTFKGSGSKGGIVEVEFRAPGDEDSDHEDNLDPKTDRSKNRNHFKSSGFSSGRNQGHSRFQTNSQLILASSFICALFLTRIPGATSTQ